MSNVLNEPLTVYIGFDKREPVAWEVCAYTLQKYASAPVNIQPLEKDKLERLGLLTRKVVKRDGQMWDTVSDAPQSTEFAASRFLVNFLQQSGWAIFMDCDMIFTGDIYDIERELDKKYALMCVKHDHNPKESTKMDNQIQTTYPRKNWSSFFAINVDHTANLGLMINDVNTRAGRDLHRFFWLKDHEIGQLDDGWNWLVNEQPEPDYLHVAHFTNGGPWFDNWMQQPNDDKWIKEFEAFKTGQ